MALVLIAVVFCPVLILNLTQDPFMVGWSFAVRVLVKMPWEPPFAPSNTGSGVQTRASPANGMTGLAAFG